MRFSNLNFGGFFGAAVCGGAGAAILYLLANNGRFPTSGIKLVILAAVGGATLGNWIWTWAQPKEVDGFSDQGSARM